MIPIIKVPNMVLSTPAKPVVAFDRKLARIIADMKAALRATTRPKGVGLAAPQVGIPLQIFLIRPTPKDEIRVCINAKILSASEDAQMDTKDHQLEGCLSIPLIWGAVRRKKSLTLHFQDEIGQAHEEEFTGFSAVIVQHEMDHLTGVLFTQRVLEQKNKLYQSTTDAKGKEILEEISI